MEGKESTVSSPSAGEIEIKPGTAAKEVNSSTPPDFAAPTPTSAKPVPLQRSSRNTGLTIVSANSGVITPRVKGETQQLEQLPDTFVSARDTEGQLRLLP